LSNILKDYPKEIILKDGTGVTIRTFQEGDGDLLSRMLNRLSLDERWFLGQGSTDPGSMNDRAVNIDLNRAISLVAVLEGSIISLATLTGKYHGAGSHIGKVRISVDPSFREKHLGTWMLLALINLAISMGLEILVMELVEGRDSSVIQGVKKLGFLKEAVLKGYLKDRDGNHYDLAITIKHLNRLWDQNQSS